MQKLLSFIRSYLFTFVFISVTLGGDVEETKVEWFYEYLQDLLEHQKKILFIIGDWNAKVGNQEIPGVTGKLGLGVQNEAGERLTVVSRECTGHSKHPLPTTQEKTLHMDITRWSIPKQIDYILCSKRCRSSIQSVKTRLGADYGSDHELHINKFRLKMKKVGKPLTIRV